MAPIGRGTRGGFTVDFSVHGEKVLHRSLLRFADRAEDMRPAWPHVAAIFEGATRRNFQTRGASGGLRWASLSPAYAARTGRKPDERILRLTGRLFESFFSGPDHIFESEPDGMRWGSRVDYGKFHQSRRPRRKLPYRPPVNLSENAKREAVRVIHRRLVAGDQFERVLGRVA